MTMLMQMLCDGRLLALGDGVIAALAGISN
jgi:hypothetical protein